MKRHEVCDEKEKQDVILYLEMRDFTKTVETTMSIIYKRYLSSIFRENSFYIRFLYIIDGGSRHGILFKLLQIIC